MVLLENDTFLTELTRLYQKSKSAGTGVVQLTFKKYDGRDRPVPKPRKPSKTSAAPGKSKGQGKKGTTAGAAGAGAGTAGSTAPASSKPHHGHGHGTDVQMSCLIRAKLHNRKISTSVHSRDMTRFQMSFSNLLKGNLDGLKKVKKTKGGGAAGVGASSSSSGATTKAT